jgi:hypothetical protein
MNPKGKKQERQFLLVGRFGCPLSAIPKKKFLEYYLLVNLRQAKLVQDPENITFQIDQALAQQPLSPGRERDPCHSPLIDY